MYYKLWIYTQFIIVHLFHYCVDIIDYSVITWYNIPEHQLSRSEVADVLMLK